MYKKINQLLTTGLLLCASLLPVAAQLVDPGDGPGGIDWQVASVNGTPVASLPKAFEAVTADNAVIKLLIGTELLKPLDVNFTTHLDLDGKPLVCASGTVFDVVAGKVLTIENGTLTGSFTLSGDGQFFAGKDVKLTGVGVVSSGESLYRILLELPGDETAGAISDVFYGEDRILKYARIGRVLCCWIPQSVAARNVTFNYTPTGGTQLLYGSEPLTATLHAESLMPTKRKTDTGTTPAAETASVTYLNLSDALKAAAEGGTVNLLRHAYLNEVVTVPSGVKLDLKGFSLSSTDLAGFRTAAPTGTPAGTQPGTLLATNGAMNGTFTLTEGVTIDKTVLLTASILMNGRQVYRTRIILPEKTSAVSFTYGDLTGSKAAVVTESGEPVAYAWLAARPADKLTATLTIGTQPPVEQIRYDIAIQANHDNAVDFTRSESVAVLKRPDGMEILYESFHDALSAATATDGNSLTLQRDVQFANMADDTHAVSENVTTVLNLNGHTLNAGNSILDASAAGATLLISDEKGTGRITGTFRIKGNVYIASNIIAGNIGVVQDGGSPSSVQLYRVLINTELTDGAADYTFGLSTATLTPKACYVKNGIACIWLPGTVSGNLTLKRGADVFIARDVRILASHSNLVTVARPDVAAKIGDVSYTTLKSAFRAVKDGECITLAANATLEEPLALPASSAVVFDLNGNTLTGSKAAAIKIGSGSTLHIKNGSLAGIFDLAGSVTADRTVLLTAAITSGGRQVYRIRLLLASGDKGQVLSYTYGTGSGTLLLTLEEGQTEPKQLAAYCWLAARPATPFVFRVGTTQRTRSDIAIQANHDNTIDVSKGDREAILYKKGEDPAVPGTGTSYETFHDALNEAGKLDGSRLWLERDVQLSGTTAHPHLVEAGVITELNLRGRSLTATNCTLNATAVDACIRITDTEQGTGRITGTFRIAGNVYIGKDIVSGNIGMVLDGTTGTQLYRALVQIDTPEDIPDGSFGTYTIGTGSPAKSCYIRNKTACIWLPVSIVPETLTLIVGGNTYRQQGVQAIASHSNVFTVRTPDVVAMIGAKGYTSLTEAFTKATEGETIVLKQSTTLSTAVAVSHNLRLELGEYTLTFAGLGAIETGEAAGSLLIYSASERGVLSGNAAFAGDICVSGSVSIPGAVSLTSAGVPRSVYRCRLYLPSGSVSGTYSYAAQNGALRLIGETNATGQSVAYVWIQPETATHDLTVSLDAPISGTRTLTDILIQATHNNQYDMEAGENVAKVGDQYYPSLKTAFDAVNALGGGTVILTRDQTLRGVQSISTPVRFDLSGKGLSLTADAGFDVKDKKTLLITDGSASADKGFMYGTMQINGAVYIDPVVRLSGTVVKRGVAVRRLTVDRLPVSDVLSTITYTGSASDDDGSALVLSGTACVWVPEMAVEEDLQFTAPDGETYETTLLSLPVNHNLRQDAYRLVELSSNATWADDANKNCNVVLKPNVVLTIASGSKLKSIHRLTLCNGAQVVCDEQVLATGGIVYRRSFAVATRWEAFSLPFEAHSITAVFGGKPVVLNPYLSDGTGGHFWLKTLKEDGTFNHVTEERIRSNVGYILSVPSSLTTDGNPEMAVSFASSPNQFLQREALPAVPPTEKGFVQLCSGILSNLQMTQPFYLLNAEGTEYVRQVATVASPLTVAPFCSYLLADKETIETVPTLRMAGVPTGTEDIGPEVLAPGSGNSPIVYAVPGGIRIETAKVCTIAVYTFSGQLRLNRMVGEGSTFIPLPAGLYIINRVKVNVSR